MVLVEDWVLEGQTLSWCLPCWNPSNISSLRRLVL
jgi:hypothetical protein